MSETWTLHFGNPSRYSDLCSFHCYFPHFGFWQGAKSLRRDFSSKRSLSGMRQGCENRSCFCCFFNFEASNVTPLSYYAWHGGLLGPLLQQTNRVGFAGTDSVKLCRLEEFLSIIGHLGDSLSCVKPLIKAIRYRFSTLHRCCAAQGTFVAHLLHQTDTVALFKEECSS